MREGEQAQRQQVCQGVWTVSAGLQRSRKRRLVTGNGVLERRKQ